MLTESADAIKGATLNKASLQRLPVPLPPLGEQKRIIQQARILMALCDELETQKQERRADRVSMNTAALDRLTSAAAPDAPEPLDAAWRRVRDHFDTLYAIPENVAEFRRALVDLASQGELVPQNSKDESATEILKRNRDRYKQRWLEIEFAKINRSGKPPRNDKWKTKYVEPTPVDTSDLPTLPESWAWERIELLGDDPLCAVQTGPFGSLLLKEEFTDSGVPVIAVGNLTGTGFKTENLYHITPDKAEQLSRYSVNAGDLLFARTGSVGRACIAPEYVADWRMTGHILRVRLCDEVVNPHLVVEFLWAANAVRDQIVGNIRGMTRPGYNTSLLESIVLPVPPRNEQDRILACLRGLMKHCDDLEASLTQQQADADRLAEAMVASILEQASPTASPSTPVLAGA